MAKLNNGSSVVAKSDDGTIQITFTVPFSQIKTQRETALKELSKTVDVPGFRKGKAPLENVNEHVNSNKLLEHTLSHILPTLLSEAVTKHSLKIIIYPKYELVKAKEDEDWEIRAVTCEAPKITLADYRGEILGAFKSSQIWTPGMESSDNNNQSRMKTHEEKEQIVLKTLLEKCKVTIPSILTEEEVNNRLSNLLSRIEKLGLSLDSYLSSIGKTAEKLREEYKKQSEESLALDFILNEIAIKEKVEIKKEEIDQSLKAAASDPNLTENIDTPERRRFIEAILKRRKALDILISLL